MTSWRDKIKVHPAADLWPMMADDELEALGRDILENGLQQRIVLWTPPEGSVERRSRRGPKQIYLLDGRNRLEAIDRVSPPEEAEARIEDALFFGHGGAQLLDGPG
jgi:hypothetical protein